MIETLTLVRITDEKGNVNYSANGDLSLDAAASALVIIAYQAEPPKKEKITGVPASDEKIDPGTG
jgi:hypothetical protein